jgi:glucose-6-phosphate 1-dehydrogenase
MSTIGRGMNGSASAERERGTGAADALVIFGITGDLARKMTFKSLYRLEARGLLSCPIIGVARDPWTETHLRDRAREAIAAEVPGADGPTVERLCARMTYIVGDYGEAATFERLAAALGEARSPVFYLEIPPSLFASVVGSLAAAGLTANARVVIEKPFGHNLASAAELNRDLLAVLDERQVMRIDHFLGKEPVMDLTYLRFANSLLEPVWNRAHIQHVQVTMAEDFGVEDRGAFYDAVGTLRDVVQNHLLQVIALIAMEPPAAHGDDRIRDKKLELFKAVRAADPARCVRGQYDGYLDIDGVAPGSDTETFVALELEIDNWRWAGVPFFVRAGKSLPLRQTEVRVVFRRPPRLHPGGAAPGSNEVVVRIDPDPGALIRLARKQPGGEGLAAADLALDFAADGPLPEPYERLLGDALRGEHALFTREDGVEETWRIVQPLLDSPPPLQSYSPGSWGPEGARDLLRGVAAWREPWLPGGGT